MSLNPCSVLLLGFAIVVSASGLKPPARTPSTLGPFHVQANRLLDANGNEYLIRGTRLPLIGTALEPFSGTTLITIRQRINMNAVVVPLRPEEFLMNGNYRARVREIVQRVNQYEMLAIIEPASVGALAFWTKCAAEFKTNPNVFFAISTTENQQRAVDEIRSQGASQPIVVHGFDAVVKDANIVHQMHLTYASLHEDQRLVGSMAKRFPVLVDGLDPDLGDAGPECAAFPSDPAEASKLIEDLLRFFDEQHVSWTISTMEAEKLIDNYAGYTWTKLDDGWMCGEKPARAGIGMVLLAHSWSADAHGFIAVNQPNGGFVIARGANASGYGRILADRELSAAGPLPLKLGNISVRVTDARGVARMAQISWTGAGWSSINFVVPANSATGPAEVAVVRSDGSESSSGILIEDVAPGLWTASGDGRGPLIGNVSQRSPDGKATQFPAWACTKEGCHAVPIPLGERISTRLRIEGTGFRHASSTAAIVVTVDGISVPVESFRAMPNGSRDEVTVTLPASLIGRGEVELLMTVDGALSNVVRIHCGTK